MIFALLILFAIVFVGAATLTFLRTEIAPFPKELYGSEQALDEITTSTWLTRQRTVLTNRRLVQAEKRLPMVAPLWQHSGSFLDLREVGSVHLRLGMNNGLWFLALILCALYLPLGWMVVAMALAVRLITLEFRSGTAKIVVATAEPQSTQLAQFLGAVQRHARADKGMPEVLQVPPPSWDVLNQGWFMLDRSEVGLVAAAIVATQAELHLLGGVTLGDPLFGAIVLAAPAIAGGRRGVVFGVAMGLLVGGAVLAALLPTPVVQWTMIGSAKDLVAATFGLGLIGAMSGMMRRVHPAAAAAAVTVWIPWVLFLDNSLLVCGQLYVTTAWAGALAACVAALSGGVPTRGRRERFAVSVEPEPGHAE